MLLRLPEAERKPEDDESAAIGTGQRPGRIGVLRQVEVWYLGFIYFGFKLIRYSLLFCLPFYLEKQLGYSTGSRLLVDFVRIGPESSAPFGSGILFDRLYGRRKFLLLRDDVRLGTQFAPLHEGRNLGISVNFVSMSIVGFMLFAPTR